jgi:hypothetical protein
MVEGRSMKKPNMRGAAPAKQPTKCPQPGDDATDLAWLSCMFMELMRGRLSWVVPEEIDFSKVRGTSKKFDLVLSDEMLAVLDAAREAGNMMHADQAARSDTVSSMQES